MNDNVYIIYLNKYFLCNEDIVNKEVIEKYLKKIFIHLKNHYKINIYCYFNINCYINSDYGVILEIKEDTSGFPFYSKKTDMKITFYNNSKFLYNIDNYFLKDILSEKDYKIYIKNNKYYLDILKLDNKNTAYIMENSKKIIYGDDVHNIINN